MTLFVSICEVVWKVAMIHNSRIFIAQGRVEHIILRGQLNLKIVCKWKAIRMVKMHASTGPMYRFLQQLLSVLCIHITHSQSIFHNAFSLLCFDITKTNILRINNNDKKKIKQKDLQRIILKWNSTSSTNEIHIHARFRQKSSQINETRIKFHYRKWSSQINSLTIRFECSEMELNVTRIDEQKFPSTDEIKRLK